MIKDRKQWLRGAFHVLFWLFILTCVNVDWTTDWFDKTIRPSHPAPLSVLVFPILFYANAFWLIPSYLNRRKWYYYLLFGGLIFVGPEIIRVGLMDLFFADIGFAAELKSRDSFLWGAPSPAWLALQSSFGYRFTIDWFRNRRDWSGVSPAKTLAVGTTTKQRRFLIPENEVALIGTRLHKIMQTEQPFLDPDLTLRDLAVSIETTDKKLSTFLNQHLHTGFSDYINGLRIEFFKEKVLIDTWESYSIVGLASECGFKSKSSFYRAFRKHVGSSPSEYLKKSAETCS